MREFIGNCITTIIILIMVALMGFCFDYNLDVYFGKDIPWHGDCILGVLTFPVTVPLTVVAWYFPEVNIINAGGKNASFKVESQNQ